MKITVPNQSQGQAASCCLFEEGQNGAAFLPVQGEFVVRRQSSVKMHLFVNKLPVGEGTTRPVGENLREDREAHRLMPGVTAPLS
jgi:hypothetical protein